MELEENHENIINILPRNDSAGFSYFRFNEGIPFDWDMKPGIPKQHHHHQQQQHIPPLTPPPAILSSNLRTPSMSHHHPQLSKPSSPNCWSTQKLRFWKRNTASEAVILRKQTRSIKKFVREGSQEFDNVDGFAGADNKCFSDRESMAMSSLPFDSSFSMFSSSSSSSGSNSQSPIREIHGKPFRSCFPMHRSKIQVSIFSRRD